MSSHSSNDEEPDDVLSTEPDDSDEEMETGDNDERETQRQNAKISRDSAERLARTICISNLLTSVKKKELLRKFRDCGKIESVRLRGGIPEKTNVGRIAKRLAVIRREFGEECHSLRAYVVFAKEDDVAKALELNGSEFQGRHIFVDRARQRSATVKYNSRDSVFIGNLPYSKVDDEALYRLFAQCGQIHRVRIIRDRETGLSRGFGYIEFTDRAAITAALNLNGTTLEGRQLRVSRCRKGTKQNQPHPAGAQDKEKHKNANFTKKQNRSFGESKSETHGASAAPRRKQPQSGANPRRAKPFKKPRKKTNRSTPRFYLPSLK